MKLTVEFCLMCNYAPKAKELATMLLNHFRGKIDVMELIPSKGGAFEIKANDRLVYSKFESKQFPNETDLIALLEAETISE